MVASFNLSVQPATYLVRQTQHKIRKEPGHSRSTLLLPDMRHDILAELLETVAADRAEFPRKGSAQPSV